MCGSDHGDDWIHKIREQMSKETEGMSAEELARYYDDISADILPCLTRVKDCRESESEKPTA